MRFSDLTAQDESDSRSLGLGGKEWFEDTIHMLWVESYSRILDLDQHAIGVFCRLDEQLPGPIFAILDSDHSKSHVLAEMMNLRPVLAPGDYLVVEDSNVNGHPVRPFFGPGPYEAVREYFRRFPSDYERDAERAAKFGFSFAPAGFLRRR